MIETLQAWGGYNYNKYKYINTNTGAEIWSNMANTTVTDMPEEDAADLQFPKGIYIFFDCT